MLSCFQGDLLGKPVPLASDGTLFPAWITALTGSLCACPFVPLDCELCQDWDSGVGSAFISSIPSAHADTSDVFELNWIIEKATGKE